MNRLVKEVAAAEPYNVILSGHELQFLISFLQKGKFTIVNARVAMRILEGIQPIFQKLSKDNPNKEIQITMPRLHWLYLIDQLNGSISISPYEGDIAMDVCAKCYQAYTSLKPEDFETTSDIPNSPLDTITKKSKQNRIIN